MTEEVVNFEVSGQRIVGTLRLAESNSSPVVLLLHGFPGTRDELIIPQAGVGIFAYVAARLETFGFSSLRIDFRGSGDSGGALENTTYSTQIADCIAAMEFISGLSSVDASKLIVLGWSQGGLVAAAAAGRTNRPAGVALWAAVGEPLVSFPNLVGQDTYRRGLHGNGTVDVTMPWGASLKLGCDFFREVAMLDPLQEIAHFGGPVFIAEGSMDKAIAAGTGQKFARAHNGINKLWVASMDHVFNTSENVDALDELVLATVTFFVSSLQLETWRRSS